MTENPQEMTVIIPSDFKFLGAIDAAIQDLAREFAFSQNSINDVSTALIEACSNAIEHGNKFDKDKRVRVSLQFNGAGFTARIYDEGKGFDFKSMMAHSAPPDPMSERGRGIIIMKAFTDQLNYSFTDEEGLCVELVKSSVAESDEEDADT